MRKHIILVTFLMVFIFAGCDTSIPDESPLPSPLLSPPTSSPPPESFSPPGLPLEYTTCEVWLGPDGISSNVANIFIITSHNGTVPFQVWLWEAKSEAEYEAVARTILSIEEIDFDEQFFLSVSLGKTSYRTDLDLMKITQDGPTVYVQSRVKRPKPNITQNNALSFPNFTVKINKSGMTQLGEIEFFAIDQDGRTLAGATYLIE